MAERDRPAPPVPPEQAPGEPSETVDDRDPGEAAAQGEAAAEEDRVDAQPREVP
jgi:hypothetical protein